ncbi:MAG TPA: type II toxin-antitoxin system ParD family antitoxin [Caulobacteraceae bacterium]|jgi:antitoxin ParD1/3/4|nr:type II toxin-antitoxin system ParD family antitoxin [Caulobacteraceae bacterium]
MTTRNISLTDPLDQFIDEQVRSGDYQNASEVVRAALRLLRRRAEEDERAAARLRAAIQEGIDDVEAGRFETVADLGRWFDALEAEVDAATRTAAE